MENRVKKKIIVLIFTLVTILGLLISNSIFNALKINAISFDNSAQRLLEKSEITGRKAQMFDEIKVLQNLGMNGLNGYYYRFDEHIKEAISPKKNLDDHNLQKPSDSVNFEFDGYESLKFKPRKGEFVLEEGVLKFNYTLGNDLQNIADLNIVKARIAEIELRIKLKKGKMLKVSWTTGTTAEAKTWMKGITIDTVPDNRFHVYRISLKNLLKAFHELDPMIADTGIIKTVSLSPSNINNDEVEIDYIRFISKRDKYQKKIYAETYETINKEMRKVLYTNTPLQLNTALTVPDGKAYLTFGMGVLEKNDPVKFSIVVKSDNTEKEVFAQKIVSPNEWQDERIDFSEWSGKGLEVSFRTDSKNGNIAFWSNPVLYTPPKERFNVIIILEDALRPDHMSCYGYFRETTPVKDAFSKNGVIFFNAFSQATETRPSCPAIMTSLYPTATGVWSFSEMLNDRYLTLAEIMRNQGFATAAFIQNGNAGPYAGLHQGFSRLFDTATIKRRAGEMYDNKLYEWIKTNKDRNFFLFLHLIDPHGPYDPPAPFDAYYRDADSGKISVPKSIFFDPEWIENPTLEGRRLLYDGEIRYNDFYFETFLAKLKAYDLLKNTLLIFIADHGEFLGEHGFWGHFPPGYKQGLHVPLLMVYPEKLPRDTKIIQPVQLIDIMPTILELADIDQSNFLIEGDSLVSLMRGKNLNFWDNRLIVSEEVVHKKKSDASEWASIFYKNWHILNSNKLNDGLSKLTKYLPRRVFSTRVFNYVKDKNEENYLNGFLFDIFFTHRVKNFIRTLQGNNMSIWKSLTKGTQKKIKYDPLELERLRALGYVN